VFESLEEVDEWMLFFVDKIGQRAVQRNAYLNVCLADRLPGRR